MKYIISPLLAYLIVCIIGVLGTAAEGYNTVAWKLIVIQVYAIPVLIISGLISLYIYKKKSHN